MARLAMFLYVFFFVAFARAGCFLPNGTNRNDAAPPDAYLPCSTNAPHSMCCRTGEGGNDQCRDDGLCSNGNILWRESCSDQTWKSDACVKLCVNDDLFFEGNPFSGTDMVITECDDGSLCCGDLAMGRPCCRQKKGVWIVNGKVQSTNPSSTSSSALPTSTSTISTLGSTTTTQSNSALASNPTSNSSNQNNTSTQASPPRDYTAVIAGSAVGGVLFLALLIGLLWWFTFKRNKAAQAAPSLGVIELDSQAGYYPPSNETQKFAHHDFNTVYHEAPANQQRIHEVKGDTIPHDRQI